MKPCVCCVSADTSFMYMIAGLCMLKLYQKRHPDINASAYTAYACLAMVIFFSVLGVVRFPPHMLEAGAEERLHISVVALCRCLGKATWFSGSFSLSSTFWPHSSSAHSSTIWAAGSWVTSQPSLPLTLLQGGSGSLGSSTFPSHHYKSVVKCQVVVFCMCIVLSWLFGGLCVCVRLWGAAQDRNRHLHGLHPTVQRTHVHRESPPLKQADKNSKI